MRSRFLALATVLALVTPLDADAGKKNKKKGNKVTEQVQEEVTQAPVVEAPPAAPALAIPDWVADVPSSGPPVLQLIDAGAEPRQALRYGAEVGQTATVEMAMKMAMKMSMGGLAMPSMEMPTMVYVMDFEIVEVDDAKVGMKSVVSDVRLEGGQPELNQVMGAVLQGMVDTTGALSIDRRGFVQSVSFEMPEGTPPELAQQVASMEQQAGNLTQPLPEEAVGLGASWIILQNQSQNGMEFAQRTTVTLTELDGSTVRLECKVDQALRDANAALPNLPPGATVTVTGFESAGGGYNLQDLSRSLPLGGSATMDLSMDMQVNMEGMSQPFEMDMAIEVNLASPDAAGE